VDATPGEDSFGWAIRGNVYEMAAGRQMAVVELVVQRASDILAASSQVGDELPIPRGRRLVTPSVETDSR
jgi:hypothetical protein